MKHDRLLYILKFQGLSLIKIGLTTDLRSRIDTFRAVYDNEFDLCNSYVVVSKDYPVKDLEREALYLLRKLDPEEIPYRKNSDGFTEIRSDEKISELLELFRMKREVFDFDLSVYDGIDFSGFHSDIIPNSYYPSDRKAGVILDELRDEIHKISNDRGVPFYQALNEILYLYFEGKEMISNRGGDRDDVSCFIVPHKAFMRKVG